MPHVHTNRLIHETSPYLLQHAHNPVDWHPWGPEAFARASDEGKPVFLSVGYSTCYWCHVMERESFENEAIAKVLNALFVPIKVDREERPDVDQLYMLAVQLMTRSGGWPMSVFMAPDGTPFYGGTYFPPEDWHGRPGFPTLLRAIRDAWDNRREEAMHTGERLLEAVSRLSLPPGCEVPVTIDQAFIDTLVGRSISDYDGRYGGFGSAPKFPRETLLKLLLSYCAQEPHDTPAKTEIRNMLSHTLDRMARGGIRDQLGGGFHRYSTDQHWLVPHFEIMLYDNAMLLEVYAQASRDLKRADFAEVARGIAEFVLSDMTGPQGQFYTALDAETNGREGATYLWTAQEVIEVLGDKEGALFNQAYGLDKGPNFDDPHHSTGAPDRNVLYLPRPLAEVAKGMHASAGQLEKDLTPLRAKLLQARKRRPQPLLDTKVLTSWNALMIRGLAVAGQLLAEPRYVEAAGRAARFLLDQHATPDGGLYRSSREGKRQIAGFVDDYAYLADALLAIGEATREAKWREQAGGVTAQMLRRFSSPAGALYFTDAAASDVLVRQSVATDSPLPSGNAVAAGVFLKLEEEKRTRDIIAAFGDALDQQGEAYAALVEVAIAYVQKQGPLAIAARDVMSELQTLQSNAGAAVTAVAQRLSPTHVQVKVSVTPGYHVNASEVPPGLLPTRLSVLAPGGDKAEVRYPAPASRLPLPDGASVEVYEGEFTLEVHLPHGGRGAREAVEMTLEVQPCSAEACLSPRRIALKA